MCKRILLATDGSAASAHAVAPGVGLACGRTGLNRLVLGSVAARVVGQSPVPVLVAR